MEEFQHIWVKNLKIIRGEEKLSLEKVSQLTGVSKTVIGQIERGESSPTITTIWKIANGLKVSFTSLINNLQPNTKVVLRNDVQVLTEDNGRYKMYPSFPFRGDRYFEFYTVEIVNVKEFKFGRVIDSVKHDNLLSNHISMQLY